MLIDTHCHLDFPQFDADRAAVLQRCSENGISYIVNVGSSLAGSQAAVALAQKYSQIYAVVGIHPHEADTSGEAEVKRIEELAKNPKVVAIGEAGLDYYKNFSQPDKQRELFPLQVKLAAKLKLPLVIHCRQAEEDCLKILKADMPLQAVIHCFSGDVKFLEQCLDLGFFVSFTCNITYKKADGLREVVKAAPLERIFLETDAPYLSPEGFRGKRNEPLYVKQLAQYIAAIKGITFEEVCRVTTGNAVNFFHLK